MAFKVKRSFRKRKLTYADGSARVPKYRTLAAFYEDAECRRKRAGTKSQYGDDRTLALAFQPPAIFQNHVRAHSISAPAPAITNIAYGFRRAE